MHKDTTIQRLAHAHAHAHVHAQLTDAWHPRTTSREWEHTEHCMEVEAPLVEEEEDAVDSARIRPMGDRAATGEPRRPRGGRWEAPRGEEGPGSVTATSIATHRA